MTYRLQAIVFALMLGACLWGQLILIHRLETRAAVLEARVAALEACE